MGRPLGQHFLRDSKAISRTVDWIQKLYDCYDCTTLLEVWPGRGALTKKILDVSPDFRVFEKDTTLEPYLMEFLEKDQIIWGDVLKQSIDVNVNRAKTVVVGNLPYYITSPILRQFFEKDSFVGGVFLVQKEVAEKIATDAYKKSYLWWLMNNAYDVHYCFTVKPKAFNPPPKVDSAVFAMTRLEQPHIDDMSQLLEILELLSPYKRKTLGAIATLNTKKWQHLTIPDIYKKRRLEEIGREEMKEIIRVNYV